MACREMELVTKGVFCRNKKVMGMNMTTVCMKPWKRVLELKQ